MPNNTPTQQVLRLAQALRARGIELELEHWDKHKHVDIYIPKGSIYIEVDGVPHYTQPSKLVSNFERDYYSAKEGFFTKHITNEAIDTHCEEIAEAIERILEAGPIQRKY